VLKLRLSRGAEEREATCPCDRNLFDAVISITAKLLV
jgi:hypothetical protein